jgi:hypothetical protein
MRVKWAPTCLLVALAATGVAAQTHPGTPDMSSMYCSGIYTPEPVPQDSYIISGEESSNRIIYRQDDTIFINHGADHNLKEGDEFLVVRQEPGDPLKYEWFKGQFEMMRAMGTKYADLGRIRVMHVGPKVSTAKVEFMCNLMMRGDIILPYTERAVPAVKEEALKEDYEMPDVKVTAGMIVSTKGFGQVLGTNTVGYVNLGASEGLKVGSYLRVFRYAGPQNENAPQAAHSEYQMDSDLGLYGWGTTPVKYTPAELPRDIIGEAVVLRVTNHTATVMVTGMVRDMYPGDYVEIEK